MTSAPTIIGVGFDPLKDLRHREGHESIATTSDTYSHPNMDELGDRVLRLVGDAI